MSEREEEIEFQESQLMLQSAMLKHQKNKLIPTGYCLWCTEETENQDDVYCCPECSQDHERYMRANRRA